MTGAGSASPGLVLRDVVAGYRRTPVLRGLSLAVEPEEMLALKGDNGSGKTTTLAVATGMLTPATGTVTWHGSPVRLHDRRQRRDFGVALGGPPIDASLTTGQVLDMHAYVHGQHPRDRRRLELFGDLGLLDRWDASTWALSSGFRQRLAFALAAAHRPALLVLDEPLANLDESGSEIIRAAIEGAKASGTAVLMAAHEADGPLSPDRVIELDRGREQRTDPRPSVLSNCVLVDVDGVLDLDSDHGLMDALSRLPEVSGVSRLGSALVVGLLKDLSADDRSLRAAISREVVTCGGVVVELRGVKVSEVVDEK